MESLSRYSSSDLENSETQATADESLAEELVPYSENYMRNKMSLNSTFFYLPWRLLPADKTTLRRCFDKTVGAMKRDIPDIAQKVSFTFPAENRPTDFGRFALDQRFNVNFPHLSLFPNVFANKSQILKLRKNLARAVADVPPPQLLITKELNGAGSPVLNKMLKRDQKSLSLRLSSRPIAFISRTTGNFFIGLRVDTGDNFDTVEYRYLKKFTKLINEQVGALGIELRGSPTGGLTKKDIAFFDYHASYIIAEHKILHHKLTVEEGNRLRSFLNNVDLLEEVATLRFVAECFGQNSNCGIAGSTPLIPPQVSLRQCW